MADANLRPVARASFISILMTTIVITVNHFYTLGPLALGLGGVLVIASTALWWRWRTSSSRIALYGYLLISTWIVAGFGLMKGLWRTTLPIFVGSWLSTISTSFPKPVFESFGFEISGVAMFLGSLFVLYYGARLAMPNLRVARPTRWAMAGVLAVGTLVAAFVATDRDRWRPPTDGVVRIGVIVPTAGPYALLGTSFVKAVEMARDDLRDTKYRYEFIIRDSGPDPQGAREIIRRTIADDRVDAIVGGISLIGQSTKPLVLQARIPHLCVCTVSWIADGAYNFTNIPSPEAEGALWSEEARRRGIRTVALLTQDYPSINNHVRALKIEAARVGIKVVDEQTFGEDGRNFASVVARAKAAAPDVYYVEALEPGLDLLGQELLRAGVHNVAAVVAPSLSKSPEIFEGAWYTDSNLRDPAFKRRFEEKYPDIRFANHMMPYAYDSVNMIVQAYERGQNPAVYLRNLRMYDGTAGLLTKTEGSGQFASAPAVWTIANGKPSLVNR